MWSACAAVVLVLQLTTTTGQLTDAQCGRSIIRQAVEYRAVIAGDLTQFSTIEALFKSHLITAMSAIGLNVDASRVVVSSIREMIWHVDNLESTAPSVQVTTDILVQGGESEADQISQALRVLTRTQLGSSIGRLVNNIDAPAYRISLTNGGGMLPNLERSCRSLWASDLDYEYNHWSDAVHVAIQFRLRFDRVSSLRSSASALSAALGGTIYLAAERVTARSFDDMGAYTTVTFVIAPPTEASAFRINELLMQQTVATLSVALTRAVHSVYMPTIRVLVVPMLPPDPPSPPLPSPPALPPRAPGSTAGTEPGVPGADVTTIVFIVVAGIAAVAALVGFVLACMLLRSPRFHRAMGGRPQNTIRTKPYEASTRTSAEVAMTRNPDPEVGPTVEPGGAQLGEDPGTPVPRRLA